MNALLEALAFLGSPGTRLTPGDEPATSGPISPERTTLSLAGIRVRRVRSAGRPLGAPLAPVSEPLGDGAGPFVRAAAHALEAVWMLAVWLREALRWTAARLGGPRLVPAA